MVEPRTAVIVVAAGAGSRLGLGEPKALVRASGRTILEHALGGIFGMAAPVQVVVVAPPAAVSRTGSLARDAAGPVPALVTVVPGGETRQQSVAAGLAALPDGVETVLVHDAARALTPPAVFDRVVAAVEEQGCGVVPTLPVTDTIKRVDASGAIVETPDRAELSAAQTPQGFPREALVAAYADADTEHTDDAALFAASGGQVVTVPGDALAFKVTTPWDLGRLESLARTSGATEPRLRTGIGTDVHAFDPECPLWLGGIYIPDEEGLSGHSDGDVLSHAVCDALLSAAGLGDLGGRFGTADDRFAGAHGDVFIAETMALVRGAGYEVVNVAAQVIAQKPRLAGRRSEIEQNLSTLVGAPVSVAATTTDRLGFVGRSEGIMAFATALIREV